MTVAATRARRSMTAAVVAMLGGLAAVLLGSGLPWATVTASVTLDGLGGGPVASVPVSGNDLASLGSLAWLGLVLAIGIAVTAGRGRWPVGVALATLGLALLWLTVTTAGDIDRVLDLAYNGRLDGVGSAAELRVATSMAGPLLTGAGAVLLTAAGLETMRKGRSWPAMGQSYRAPGDRSPAPLESSEPPWEGD
jgi:hypothetical protein